MTSQNIGRLRTVVRIALGVLLLWAAVSKLARPVDFLASIYAYELPLPRPFLKFVAILLPWSELICGLLLIGNVAVETALFYVAFLFGVFVLATGEAWLRRLPISCGCFDLKIFGLGERFPGLITFLESVGFAFFRNILLLAAAIFLLRHRLAELRGPSVTPQREAAVDTSLSELEMHNQSPIHKLSRKQRKRIAAAAR